MKFLNTKSAILSCMFGIWIGCIVVNSSRKTFRFMLFCYVSLFLLHELTVILRELFCLYGTGENELFDDQ